MLPISTRSRRATRFPLLAAALLVLAATACGGEASGRQAGGGGRGGPGGGGGPGGRGPGSNLPTAVEIEVVGRASLERTTTVAGTLEPIRAVGVNAQMSGSLLSVNVEEGSQVRAGQVLAEIDATELAAQARSAEAALEFAKSTAERTEALYRQQIVTAAEYERDRAAFEAARASLEQLRARQRFARITAPTSGVVTEKLVERGDVVSPQTRLFTIADVSTLVTRVQVSEREVSSLRTGAPVDLSIDALGGARVEGRIRRVFPAADSATRLVPVEVALTGRALERLRPGYTARATFRLDERDDALVVPSRAVMGPTGSRTVIILRQGLAERRPVRVGADVDGRTEVFEGLKAGDTVVVAGNALIREGAPVRIVQPIEGGDAGGPPGAQPVTRPVARTDSAARPQQARSPR